MQAELDFRASGKQRRYSWDYDEQFEIFTQALEGSGPVNLTNKLGDDAEGAYSPDGSHLVFASNRRAYSGEMTPQEAAIIEHDKSFMTDIDIMNADGSDVRRLTDAVAYDGGPFFSADGRFITWRRFSKDGSRAEIFTKNLATGEEQPLTRMGVMSWAPYFHPSGDYLIFAANREGSANCELFVIDAEGQRDPVRLTTTAGFDGPPVFTPDGKRLSWTSNRTASHQSQIFRAAWDDAEARRLLGLDASTTETAAALAGPALPATAAAIRAEDAQARVARLTADEMAGRLAGTEGECNATAYVARVFEQLGLQPAGDGGGWFQAFPFASGALLGSNNALTVSGVTDLPNPQLDADWRPLALSRSGEAAAAEIAFAGYGIVVAGAGEVPDYDAYGELDVAGKWAFCAQALEKVKISRH